MEANSPERFLSDFSGSSAAWMQCVPYVPVKRVAAEVPEKLANVWGSVHFAILL